MEVERRRFDLLKFSTLTPRSSRPFQPHQWRSTRQSWRHRHAVVTLSFEGADIVDGTMCDDLYPLNMSAIHPSHAQSRP